MRERSELTDSIVALVTNHAHQVARGYFIVRPDGSCNCRVCRSAYKMYLANANGSSGRRVRRRARPVTAALQEERSDS